MGTALQAIGINLFSNFLTMALLIGLGWLLYFVCRRRKLLKFFGVLHTRRVVVYLARLRLPRPPGAIHDGPSGCAAPEDRPRGPAQPRADGWIGLDVGGPSGASGPGLPPHAFGALGADGLPRSFAGPAIPLAEAELATIFERFFNFVIPSANALPGIWRKLLWSDVSVDVVASPGSEEGMEGTCTVISVGSPAYNSVSGLIETRLTPMARFVDDHRYIELADVPQFADERCAFVQKVTGPNHRQVAFYVAGITAIGTKGAGYYLAREWKRLADKYRTSNRFCIILRVHESDFRRCQILCERGEP